MSSGSHNRSPPDLPTCVVGDDVTPTRGVARRAILPPPVPQHTALPSEGGHKASLEDVYQDSGYLSQALSTDGMLSGPVEGEDDSGELIEVMGQLQLGSPTTDPTQQDDEQLMRRKYVATLSEAFSTDEDGDTHLHLAIIYGLTKVAECLVSLAPHAGFLNISNTYRQTPLHLAVLTGHARLVRRLLLAGADPGRRDRHGNAPLHLACERADRACVQALTEPVAVSESQRAAVVTAHALTTCINEWNYQGLTCLHLAAISGDLEIVAHLICFGASVEATEGRAGRTSLHLSVETGNVRMLRFLVEACGAAPDSRTYAGLSSWQLAAAAGRPDLAELLVQLGAAPAQLLDDSDMDSMSSSGSSDSDSELSFRDNGVGLNTPQNSQMSTATSILTVP